MIVAQALPLLALTATVAASDAFCSCTHSECYDLGTCCPSAIQTCLSGQEMSDDLTYNYKLPSDIKARGPLSSEERRAVSYTAIQRLQQSGQVHQRWYMPLWEEGNGTVLTSPIVEVEEIYRTAAGLFGALIKSDGLHTLVLNGESRLYERCTLSSMEDHCFPLVLEPAVQTLTKINPERIVIDYSPSARQGAHTMASKLSVTLKDADIVSEELAFDSANPSCVLLCGTTTLSEPNPKQPAARSEYRYLPMPGATERITWLTSVASVVIIGTWNGSYKFSMA